MVPPGELSEHDVGDGGGAASRKVVTPSHHVQNNFLLVALLDHLSAIYGDEETPRYQLYKALVNTLVGNNRLKGVGTLDEASSLRAQYNVAFSKILKSVIDSIKKKSTGINIHERARQFFNPRLNTKQPLLTHSLNNIITHNTSRYHEDFSEIKKVGYGAYGNVYKVKNRLDNCEYAIKKISFESSEPDLWLKIINEVKLLAQLNHKHVVRYHNAWIEYENPSLLGAYEPDRSNLLQLPPIANVPALTYDISSLPADGDQESDGIIFEDSPVSVGKQPVEEISPQSTPGSDSVSSSCIEVISSRSSDELGRPNFPNAVVVLHIQMELCMRTLKDWIYARNDKCRNTDGDKYSVVDAEMNLQLLRQILKGLCFIHSHNLMHRDIKPKNIFLSPNETFGACEVAKVGDFGLARHDSSSEPLTPHPGRNANPDISLGMYTCGVGTTIYAAPEQLNGSSYTQKCDMYSLGMVLFEMYEPFGTEMERIEKLRELRTSVLPAEFTARWPRQAQYVQLLLSENASLRPLASELLESELFNSRDQIISKLRSQNSTLQNENADLRRLLAKRDAEIAMLRRELVSIGSKEPES